MRVTPEQIVGSRRAGGSAAWTPQATAQARLASSAAVEPFLQVAQGRGHLLARLRADEERNEQLADPVSHELEFDRHARPRTVVERRDGPLDIPPDRSIDAS